MTNIPFFKNAEISLNADENIMEIATENSMYKIFQNAGMLVDVKQYVDKIDKIKSFESNWKYISRFRFVYKRRL